MRICAAIAAVVALTTACGGEPVAAPPATTTTTTVVPPAPAELDQRAKAAIAPPGAFDALGGQVKQSTPATDDEPGADGEVVTTLCETSEMSVDGTSVARARVWTGRVNLFQRVHAMSDRTAAALVGAVQTRLAGCAKNRGAAETKAVAKPEGVDDFYAHCEANPDPELVPWSCHALMGRGTLITVVVASGQTKAAAEAQLTSVAPIFAQSFVKA
ncbi:hypothetical protein DFR72_107126 [Lentzea flaviverrucosa]|uniref:PknH-like extracellular domain-containing protein n=2 Tax=Lentzea flaviverrucosa TaxID=200379 RepID=A0A1H9JER7_9PSEU|nr:hypothetical protein DFR72_107126 [Lentzea flaviverrucosa]SEQ85491.1 hypothetical protein SAMN05216195_103219 [Lentzea flaviverrucosa]